METVYYILLAVFGAYSIMHLIFCFIPNEPLRKWSKPFCLLILGIAAIFGAPQYPLIYIGAFIGMVGDIFLIFNKDTRRFLIGTGCFVVGHICYLLQAIILLNNLCFVSIPWWVFLILIAAITLLGFLLYPATKKAAGKISLIGNFYILFLLTCVALGIVLAYYLKNEGEMAPAGGIFFTIGYIFFIISDLILIITTFVKDIEKRDFPIMLFYLLAQLFIISGLINIIIQI